jgi:hypothetical protein
MALAASPTARSGASPLAPAARGSPRRALAPPASRPVAAAAAAAEPVEAILFDMDGVLTLSEELSRE